MTLSPAQRSAMLALDCAEDWMSSYALRCKLNTLNALVRKGLASRVRERGADFMPHACIKYKLTDAGRAWCKANFTDVLTTMIEERK